MIPSLSKLSLRADTSTEIGTKRPREEEVEKEAEVKPVGVLDEDWDVYINIKNHGAPTKRPGAAYKLWSILPEEVKKCREQNKLHSKDGQLSRLVPFTSAPGPDELLNGNKPELELYMLNVKPPWAGALVHGVKDVENRSWDHPKTFEGERWTLIVASGTQSKKYEEEAVNDLETRLRQSGQEEWIGRLPNDTHQHILGLVKLRCIDFDEFTYGEGRCSVWYNGSYFDDEGNMLAGDKALLVTEAFAFRNPILYTKGMLGMNKFKGIAENIPKLTKNVAQELKLLHKETVYGDVHESSTPVDSGDKGEDQALSLPLPAPPQVRPSGVPVHVNKEHLTFDEWGCEAFTFELEAEKTEQFLENLNQGAQLWMLANLERAFEGPPRKDEFKASYEKWKEAGVDVQKEILSYFDLRTREGAIRLFDAQLRKASIPFAVRAYLNDRLEYAKQGMKNTGQGNSDVSWTKTGFGIWTKIWTQLGLELLTQTVDILGKNGLVSHVTGIPHVIYKPPRGDKLAAHHDRMTTKDLLANLREHVKSSDPSTTAWVKKHGMQALAHIHGGYADGYTYTVGPLNPTILLACLDIIQTEGEVEDIAKAAWSTENTFNNFLIKSSGPYFVDWYKLVGRDGNGPLNERLKLRKIGNLRIIPITPPNGENSNAAPYLAMWPVGFPHGSMNNDEPRVSLTMELKMGERPKTTELPRWAERLQNLSILAHTDSDEEERRAKQWLQNDTKPYHDGQTHRKPEMMADLQGKDGPFASVAPTQEGTKEFLKTAGLARQEEEEDA
jgi:hypothetical protein